MSRKLQRIVFLAFFLLSAALVGAAEFAPYLRVTYLDVGQGDSILLRTGDKNILIDAGDDKANAGNAVIVPYLKKEGIKRLDACVISHPHRDHFGGFLDVVNAFQIGEFIYSTENVGTGDAEGSSGDAIFYQKLHDAIVAKGIPYRKVAVGDSLDWGKKVKVDLFHAEEAGRSDRASDTVKVSANEHSLIFKVTAGEISYMFSGDAEKIAEGSAVENFKTKLQSTVLKSGHHGSKTSSNYPFMDMVKPEYAVISVGAKNSFGHPNKETLEKYSFYKMKVFRTDQDGTVESLTDGKTVKFISNQSELDFTKKPEIISLTANSATIQWVTNKVSDSRVKFGVSGLTEEKFMDNEVTIHTVTLSGLKPGTSYSFQVQSQDARQDDQIITSDGSFKTPVGEGVPLPKITQMVTSVKQFFMKRPFNVKITVQNPGEKLVKGLKLNLYHTAMTEENLLGSTQLNSLKAKSQLTPEFPVQFAWLGNVELLAVLLDGKTIIDTSSINITIEPKIFLVDCAHGNIDYFTGKFAGMKMDLYQNLGFTFRSISKAPVTADMLKEAFVVAIPEFKEAYTAEELKVLKDFTSKGGGLMLYSKADYANRTNPELPNAILKAVGSTIRFNDDEFCDPTNNIGPPYQAWIKTFPSPLITGVDTLLVRSCCTLINSKMGGLAESKTIQLFATGDEDSYNINADQLEDGYIYASHTPRIPIPVVAGEDLGTGRVVCVGETLYDDKLYAPNAQIQTPQFNRCVANWIGQGKEKTLRDLLRYMNNLESVSDLEVRAIRYDDLKSQVMDVVKCYVESGNAPLLKNSFEGFEGNAVKSLKDAVKSSLQFEYLHQGREADLESLKEF